MPVEFTQSEHAVHPPSWDALCASAEDTDELLSFLLDNPEAAQDYLHDAEQELAAAGAQLELGIHRRSEKTHFAHSLDAYLALIHVVTKTNMDQQLATGATENDTKLTIVKEMAESKRRVLKHDTAYRLENSFIERSKKRIAEGPVKRTVGKLAILGAQGGLIYLAVKGILDTGEGQNLALTASAVGTQLGMRAIGQEISDHAASKIDEYEPIKIDDVAESEDTIESFAFQDNHMSVVEGALAAAALEHSFDDPEKDPPALVSTLVDTLRVWYGNYYQQPSLKDRAKIASLGAFTLTCAATTAVQL